MPNVTSDSVHGWWHERGVRCICYRNTCEQVRSPLPRGLREGYSNFYWNRDSTGTSKCFISTYKVGYGCIRNRYTNESRQRGSGLLWRLKRKQRLSVLSSCVQCSVEWHSIPSRTKASSTCKTSCIRISVDEGHMYVILFLLMSVLRYSMLIIVHRSFSSSGGYRNARPRHSPGPFQIPRPSTAWYYICSTYWGQWKGFWWQRTSRLL